MILLCSNTFLCSGGTFGHSKSTGPGVITATFRYLFNHVLAEYDTFWGSSSRGALLPQFSPFAQTHEASDTNRNLMFETFGKLIALHIAFLRRAPQPIRAPVLLSLLIGVKAMDVSIHYLHVVDSEAADDLNPWSMLQPESPITPEVTRLLAGLGVPVRISPLISNLPS